MPADPLTRLAALEAQLAAALAVGTAMVVRLDRARLELAALRAAAGAAPAASGPAAAPQPAAGAAEGTC